VGSPPLRPFDVQLAALADRRILGQPDWRYHSTSRRVGLGTVVQCAWQAPSAGPAHAAPRRVSMPVVRRGGPGEPIGRGRGGGPATAVKRDGPTLPASDPLHG
jgi:hypothetical protein